MQQGEPLCLLSVAGGQCPVSAAGLLQCCSVTTNCIQQTWDSVGYCNKSKQDVNNPNLSVIQNNKTMQYLFIFLVLFLKRRLLTVGICDYYIIDKDYGMSQLMGFVINSRLGNKIFQDGEEDR